MNPKALLSDVLKPPFTYSGYADTGNIFDGNGHRILDVRGWGTLGYYENGAELQDEMANLVADLLTKHFENNK
jgi:hypothetical protein